jgi:alkylation response protein AidB-like acyl-CoA dehydrogenase
MNFEDTPQEASFRAEARAWIDANAPKELLPDLRRSTYRNIALRGQNLVQVSKSWQSKKQSAGWACLHWPKEYGGRGATPIERVIWQQEEGPYAHLSGVFFIGQGMCGPTLMAYADEDVKRRYLLPRANGEEIWCQLFSEPAAGSDVAGLRTRAVQDGGEWVVDGQKIWTRSLDLLRDAVDKARRLSVDLSPPVLEGDGLIQALKWLRPHMRDLQVSRCSSAPRTKSRSRPSK